jgi:hypothetical protein
MSAAARVVKRHLPHIYDSLWAPVLATPVVAPMTIYPTPAQQQGRGRREWDVRDALPVNADDAAFPTEHAASRVSGVGVGVAADAQRACVALGVSNAHSASHVSNAHSTILDADQSLRHGRVSFHSRPRRRTPRVRVAHRVRIALRTSRTRPCAPAPVLRPHSCREWVLGGRRRWAHCAHRHMY